MAFNEQELAIIKAGQAAGKTRADIEGAISRYRAGTPITQPVKKESYIARVLKDIPTDIKETGKSIIETVQGAIEKAKSTREQVEAGTLTPVAGTAGIIGSGLSAGARAVGEIGLGAAKTISSPEIEKVISDTVSKAVQSLSETTPVQTIIATYNSLTPNQKSAVDLLLGAGESVLSLVGAGQTSKIVQAIKNGVAKAGVRVAAGTKGIIEDITTTASKLGESPVVAGTVQKTKELAQTIPRAVEKVQESAVQSAEKAARIKAAPAPVAKAIQSGLDEPIIEFVLSADKPTLSKVKEMVDIASKPKKIGDTVKPTIVAGKAAEEAFDLVEKNLKSIGKELGDEVAALPKNVKVDMRVANSQLDDVLAQNGISVQGRRVSFAPESYTQAEMTRIREVLERIKALPDQLTPQQVRDMDNLLSRLQRETRMEGLQDILVTVNGQKKNMFQVLRESFTNQLENINPRIRELNRAYRNEKELIEDLEDTIFKTSGRESLKNVDLAEFANLRRIMGEAVSSPEYRAILEQLDTRARQLGYTGAKASDLAAFAEELRTIFPETIPQTGFQGGIRTGVSEILNSISKLGAIDTTDKQKALKALIDELNKLPG